MNLAKLKTINLSILCMLINLNLISMQQEKRYKTGKKSIKQYKVINNGDREFSGYHALYNNLILLKSRKNKALKKFLTTNENRDSFFGSQNARWQNFVIENRVKSLARFYIEDCLINNLKYVDIVQESSDGDCHKFNLSNNYAKIKLPTEDTQATAQYCQKTKLFLTIMPEVVKAIVNELYIQNTQENKTSFKIKFSMLKDCFSKELIKRKLAIPRPLFSDIFKQAHFKLEFEIISDHQIQNTEKQELYNIDWHATSNNDFASAVNIANVDTINISAPGHWLIGKDLEHIIRLEKDKGVEIPEDLPIFCLDKDIKELFNLEHLKKLADQFMDINYTGSAMFLIYIQETKHWVSCFVIKDSDEAPKFLFTDSLNVDRTKTDSILTLISLLSNHVLDIRNIELPPLDLLLDNKIDNIKAIIYALKDEDKRKAISRGLLLHGAPKTGKFSLAYTIAKLTNWKFLYVDAASIIGDLTLFNKTEGTPAIGREELQNKGNAILSLFTANIKGQLPMIIFIRGIDQILKGSNSNESKNDMMKFMLNILIALKSKYQDLIYIISTSYLAHDKLPNNNNVLELFNAFKLDLPDVDKRKKIICYYFDKLFSNVIKKNDLIKIKEKTDLQFMTSKFSCLDIKEFMTLAATLIERGEKNAESIGLLNYLSMSSLDFNREPLGAIALLVTPFPYIFDPIMYYSRNEYEDIFYKYAKIQTENVINRQKANAASSNKDSLINVPELMSMAGPFLMSKGTTFVVFLVTEFGKVIINVALDKVSEKAKEKINDRWPTKKVDDEKKKS